MTPADIQVEIDNEHYFNAGEGIAGRCFREVSALHSPHELELLTFCVLRFRNGFTVTGGSACASPENCNAEIGRRIARENVVNKIWPLLGFRLRDKLAGTAAARDAIKAGEHDNANFPLGKACDLSGEDGCEACQRLLRANSGPSADGCSLPGW